MPGNARIPVQDRHRIIESHSQGEDFVALAKNLGVNRSSAYSIVKLWLAEERAEPLPRCGGRKVIIDEESLDLAVMLIEANPLLTLKQMRSDVRECFSNKPNFSISALGRALDGELITLKHVRDIPAERNSDRVKTDRKIYSEWMVNSGLARHRVYVDECGYNLWTRRSYGRSVVGERSNRVVGGQRGRNVTVIAAISDQVGLLYHEVHVTSVTKDVFTNYMFNLSVILGMEPAVIILDNAPCHRHIDVEFPQLEIKFLPAYSPFLNPIENTFSVLKSAIKRHLQYDTERSHAQDARAAGRNQVQHREAMLQVALDAALPSVTREIVANQYAHAATYLTRCILLENIFN